MRPLDGIPPRKINGFWWEPDKPDIRWFGTLHLEVDKTPKLEIFFERISQTDGAGPLGSVILGRDERGTLITLLYVSSPSRPFLSGVVSRRLSAGYALLGVSVPSVEAFATNELRLRVQYLYGWTGITGFLQPNAEPGESAIRYRHPDAIRFQVSADLAVEFGMYSCSQNNLQEQKVEEEAWVSFSSNTGFSLRECFDHIATVRLLLHFASLEPVYPVLIEAVTTESEIEIWASYLREAKTHYPAEGYWMFRFDDFRNRFADFMREWIDYTKTYHEALDCYSATIYHSLPEELEHLSLTQGLDAYHGIKFQSHKDRDFKAKLSQLASAHAASLAGLVTDLAEFVDCVHITRNYYTHHNPKWRTTGKVAERADLCRMNEKLRILFQTCILSDVGVPADRFHRLRRQLAFEIVDYV